MFLYNLHINETKIEQIHISHGFQTSNYEKEKKTKYYVPTNKYVKQIFQIFIHTSERTNAYKQTICIENILNNITYIKWISDFFFACLSPPIVSLVKL